MNPEPQEDVIDEGRQLGPAYRQSLRLGVFGLPDRALAS